MYFLLILFIQEVKQQFNVPKSLAVDVEIGHYVQAAVTFKGRTNSA